LIQALREKKRIVVIVGAGISAEAGIPTFDSMSIVTKNVFNIHMYRNDNDTKKLNEMFSQMYNRAQAASPTQFHHVLAAIAKEGRLHRLYTQNIDGLDTQLASLKTQIPLSSNKPWPRTIQLHGDLKTVMCGANPLHLSHFNPALFASEPLGPRCTECKVNKRTGKVPVVRPRVWLYQDWNYPDDKAITTIKEKDLQQKVDLVVVAGTALKIDSAQRLARDMCKTVRENGGTAVWINLKAPAQKLDFFDVVIVGSCEIVARHVS
ncbi:DHS-like NAD/FAD-binding domain-containing protein, partial [Cadophora sp. DSE1049]